VAPVTPIVSIPNPSPIIQPLGPNPMANQGVDKYCQILHYAMKGVGTDENAIINVVCNTDTMTRAEIRRRYIALYGKDLIKRLKEDLSGNFEDTVVGMFMTPPEYDAYCLYKAMKGLGTNEGVLIEIIGTRNNLQIQMIKAEFLKNYGKSCASGAQDPRADPDITFFHYRSLQRTCSRSPRWRPSSGCLQYPR
jgi:annexin A7/11